MADIRPQQPTAVVVSGDTVHIAAASITDACAARLIARPGKQGAPPSRAIERIVVTGVGVNGQAGAGAQWELTRETLERARRPEWHNPDDQATITAHTRPSAPCGRRGLTGRSS